MPIVASRGWRRSTVGREPQPVKTVDCMPHGDRQDPVRQRPPAVACLARAASPDRTQIWLIYYKKHSGRPRIPYNDAVEEALCYGWIDSITKPVDEDRWTQR